MAAAAAVEVILKRSPASPMLQPLPSVSSSASWASLRVAGLRST